DAFERYTRGLTPLPPLPCNIPAGVSGIVLRALEPAMASRTPTAAQLLRELLEVVGREGVTRLDLAEYLAERGGTVGVAAAETAPSPSAEGSSTLPPSESTETSRAPADARANHRGVRLLLIDGEAVSDGLLARELRRRGYAITIVEGSEAPHVDVALFDVVVA